MVIFDPALILTATGLPTVKFAEKAELQTWAQGEVTAWARMPVQAGILGTWREDLVRVPQSILNVCSHLPTSEAVAQHRLQLEDLLRQYGGGGAIASASPDGIRILQKVAAGDHVGAILDAGLGVNRRSFGVVIDGNVSVDARALFREMTTAVGIESLVKNRAEHEAAFVENTVRGLESQVDASIDEARRLISEMDSQLERLGSRYDGQLADLSQRMEREDRKQERLRERLKRRLGEGRAEYLALNQTYKAHLQLEAPAKYWFDRSRRNTLLASSAFCLFVVLVIAVVFAGALNLPSLRSFISLPGGKVDIGAVIAVAPIVLLLLWIFRMVGRVFATALGESVDAAQRHIMVTTFLALLRDPNSKMSEAERVLILQALFRPAGAKVEEETAPLNIWEVAVKAATGSKS